MDIVRDGLITIALVFGFSQTNTSTTERRNGTGYGCDECEDPGNPSFWSYLECSGTARTDSLNSLTYVSEWGQR